MKTIKVHVIGGWSEGAWQINQLAKAFPENMSLTKQPSAADVIVAHSAGCYSLPADITPELVLLIAPPYSPERSVFVGLIINNVLHIPRQLREWGVSFWFRLRLHNLLFALKRPAYHLKIWRSINGALLRAEVAHRTILIRNREDASCSPSLREHAAAFKHVRYTEMPGLHEDCWVNPQAYVELILKEL